MKRPIILIVVVLAVAGIVGVGITSSKQSKTEDHSMQSATEKTEVPKENEIYMQDFAFNPKKMTVKKGTTITWTNKDSARHDIKPDSDYGQAFEASKLMMKGESYSFTFNTPGTYNYHCTPHPYMKAMIEVTE